MPWFPIYADATDAAEIISYLSADMACSFIVGDGPGRWRAVPEINISCDGEYMLWVPAGGPLLLIDGDGEIVGPIPDPALGWAQMGRRAASGKPYFGVGALSVVRLTIRTQGRDGLDAIGMSGFQWVGNYYRCLGRAAAPAMEKWWQYLRRGIKKKSTIITRCGQLDGPRREIWAMPSAYEHIRKGARRDVNPSIPSGITPEQMGSM